MKRLVIYTDGGSRGNPGQAAIGAVVGGKQYSEAIGSATNNEAEYRAVILALQKAKQQTGKENAKQTSLEIRSDSELLVSHMNGRYKIKERNLRELFIQVWNLKTEFKSVSFVHIPREENKTADSLVNQALDTLI